jgi:hypothetical protein
MKEKIWKGWHKKVTRMMLQLSQGLAANTDGFLAVLLLLADTSLGWARNDQGSRSAIDVATFALEMVGGDAAEPIAVNDVGRNGFPNGDPKPPSTSLSETTGDHTSPSLPVNESEEPVAAREWEGNVDIEEGCDGSSSSISSAT